MIDYLLIELIIIASYDNHQGAVPHIMENTPDSFFLDINKLLKEAANLFYERLKEIPLVDCPHKPEGSMFTMVKKNLYSNE